MDVYQSPTRLLIDELNSPNHISRRNTLKRLETTFLPELNSQNALAILRGEDEGKSHALGHILLKGLSDGDSPEICREKSAACLQLFLTKALGEEDSYHVTKCNSFLREFYIEICRVFHARFLPQLDSRNANKPVEEAEEIRLILVQIMTNIMINMGTMKQKESSVSREDRVAENLTHYKHMTEATSMVCQSLARTALADTYPDLKRASCFLLKSIAEAFPHVVRMHGASLLHPITGGSMQFGLPAHDIADQDSCASSKICLLRHRHAKTRNLALEAIADVMSCCDISSEDFHDDKNCHQNSSPYSPVDIIDTGINNSTLINTNGNGGSHFSDLLVTHVLSSLESFPPYDRSAAVRIALSKAVGKLLKLLLKGGWSSLNTQTSYKILLGDGGEPSEKKCMPPIGRLLALLIMGLSDKAKSVRSAALTEFRSIGELWDKGQKNAPNSENKWIHFFPVFSLDVIVVLLLNISNNFCIDEKTRALQTLSVTIKILNHKQCQVVDDDFISYWDEVVMTRIVSGLCESLKNNEKDIFQAVIDCSNTLGESKNSRCSASGIILPALIGMHNTPSHDLTMDHENSGKCVYSTPLHFESALYLLAGLVRGSGSSDSSETLLDISEIDEISRAVTNERVLENVFLSSGLAIALFDVCHALGRMTLATINRVSNSNPSGGSSRYAGDNNAVRNILYCCVYLLGCPDTYEIHQPVLILLESLSFMLLNEKSSSGLLLEMHFKGILDLITKKLGEMKGQNWQIGDPDLCAFDALLRYSSRNAVGEHFDTISPILERHLSREISLESSQPTTCKSTGYETKLFIMALMESIVSDPSFPKDSLQLFAEKLINSAIIPNLAWQVGGMASALRKLSVAVLFSILSCEGGTARVLYVLAPRLLPILNSNLSDDDASTRELVSASLEKIFEMLPGALGEEPVHQLYPDIMKCLDDSSDSVRFAACAALKQFLRSAPPEKFRGTAIEYIAERLFVHMDDPESAFQENVFDVLTIALDVDTSVVLKNIETALLSHKSKILCNLLKERADKKMILEKML